ncbi:MAG: diguanylate cyclase [Gammaproteobacteria bacterium]|nr:diguanylate cyclase [Gammaproteobacteria bacterium]
MPDIDVWKQKYRDSLLEMDHAERQWRRVEKILRRLVNRLCAARMGEAAALDDDLAAIAAANRRDADAEELEQLAAALTQTLAALDVHPPAAAPPPALWTSTREAVGTLLTRLAYTPDPALAQVRTDAGLAALVQKAADLVATHRASIERERSEAAAVLARVGNRLEELAVFFDSSNDVARSSLAATQTLNADVMARVRELSQGSQAATDLHALRTLVDDGLRSMDQCVRDFREREEARHAAQTARADAMRERIASLEDETRNLNRKLAAERQIARIDALTGVANRKAFDERLAQEIKRCGREGRPAVLMIWDIDNFKSVNDSYGHRAGDAVIRSVAKSLAGAIRATDFIARVGGEEFALILWATDGAAALPLAEQMRAAVAALRFHFRGTPVPVTASCGIAEFGAADTAELAFERADAVLYQAKTAGRNRCLAA